MGFCGGVLLSVESIGMVLRVFQDSSLSSTVKELPQGWTMGEHLKAKEAGVWLVIHSFKTEACHLWVNGGLSGSDERCSQHYI